MQSQEINRLKERIADLEGTLKANEEELGRARQACSKIVEDKVRIQSELIQVK